MESSSTGQGNLSRRFLLWIICAVSIVGGAGCFVRGAKVTRGADRQLNAGEWNVDGISLNASLEQVISQIGQPENCRENGQRKLCNFNNRETIVTFDPSNQAMRVWGKSLLNDGTKVIQASDFEEQIFETLGSGYLIERFSPKGGGIIATGSVSIGRWHHFDDEMSRFQIFVNRSGEIVSIESRRLSDDPKFWN